MALPASLPPPERNILRRIARALLEGLIEPNDRILLGLSGGKDSLTLAIHLAHLQPHFQIPFSFACLHIQADFPGCAPMPGFLETVRGWGIPVHVLPVPIRGRLKPGQRLNCWWCSTQRRKELLEYAHREGYARLALAHHLDDILETVLMNMAYKGKISAMLPLMRYDRFPAVVIRPLCYVTVDRIVEYARRQGFLAETASCPFGSNSLRLRARRALQILAEGAPGVKETLLRSLSRIETRYLPAGGYFDTLKSE